MIIIMKVDPLDCECVHQVHSRFVMIKSLGRLDLSSPVFH